jgi:preprotein translocase subunit SecA
MPIQRLIEAIIGDPRKKVIKRMEKLVPAICEHSDKFLASLSDEDFPKKTQEFRVRFDQGESLDQLLPEAFGLVKAAAKRLEGKTWDVRQHPYTWDMPTPYDVQLVGGMAIHEGHIAEMRTGEGKTLVCTFPAYLNALSGKSVFVVTVNDYLAERDSEWMGGLYRFLGLKVGVVKHGQSREDKRAAYQADITYGTNNEFGFDYLRDNMALRREEQVQRGLHYAIVDEVDSILIDEARTPLVISAPGEESTSKYASYSQLVTQLKENEHYVVDEKQRIASLTEDGIARMEKLLGVENIYTDKGFEEVHHIEQALRANAVYKKDVDYMVKNGEVVIVDEFTGRLMEGRRFGQGLHQAIEAKEGVDIKRESKTLATVTFQNYFRMFEKIAGMTGTALTEAEEFIEIYGLDVLPIPTNKTVAREDKSDSIYKNTLGKFNAIVERTKELHAKGQPVLIGTISVEKSEMLSKLLEKAGVPHQVLNAKHHEREAEIVAGAGQKGAVTIATNMAGRGTDIKLGAGVKELGGLCVMGSERHESRRIDNQLRGRSGRQGDPGLTQFYVAMDDDLMRIFGGSQMQSMMERLGLPDDMPIENKLISRSIESAQKKVEGRNFDIRKHLVQYDDVLNTHRDIVYTRRQKVIEKENLRADVLELLREEVLRLVTTHPGNPAEIVTQLNAIHKDHVNPLNPADLAEMGQEALIDQLSSHMEAEYLEKENSLPEAGMMRQAERVIMLKIIDTHWMRHINELRELREAVSLMGYGQRNPLIEYKNQAFTAFEELSGRIDRNIVSSLFRVKITLQAQAPATSSSSGPVVGPIGAPASGPIVHKARPNETCPCGSRKKFKRCHGE